MFYQFWIVYAVLGLLAATAVFVWAVKSGQFADQNRARFIPLRDDPLGKETPKGSAFNPVVIGLAAVLFLGFCVIGVILVFAVLWA